MAEVLYRKYRPTSFAQIEGQESVVQILRESILQGKVSHAYLFCGPRGCGKTTIARIMAKAVNCENFAKLGDICNECDACNAINNGSMDIMEMDAASNRGIEEIRVVRDTVNFVPNFLAKKVYIIDEAHMLTKEAFNALLKTLEEPPEHVVFVLATTESHKLPVTILSRVTRFDFKLGSENEILNKLGRIVASEGYSISLDSLRLIFEYSGGSFRDSESLLSKVILTSSSKEISDDLVNKALGVADIKNIEGFIEGFKNRDVNRLTAIITEISESNDNVPIFLEQLIQSVNNKLIEQAKKGTLEYDYISIANLAMKIRSEIRDFSDKSTIANLALFSYFNREQMPAAVSVKPKVENQVSLKKEEDALSVEESKVEKKEVVDIKDKSFTEAVAIRAQSSLPRLKGMMNTAKIEIIGDEIKVSSPYKFNLAYMSKKEARDIFLEVAKELYGKNLGISFSIDTDIQISAKNEAEKVENDDKIIEPKKKIDKTIDNSNLVEEIF